MLLKEIWISIVWQQVVTRLESWSNSISLNTSISCRKGKNVLAIAGLNNAKSSSDLLINAILSTEPLVSKKTNDRKKRGGDI